MTLIYKIKERNVKLRLEIKIKYSQVKKNTLEKDDAMSQRNGYSTG